MQCSLSFDSNWGKQNDPTACWHQLHPQYQVLQHEKTLSYTLHCMGGVIESPNCVGCTPLEPPLTGNTPLYSIFRAKDGRKTINIFNHFHGLIPDTTYKHLEYFVTLEKHSQLRVNKCKGYRNQKTIYIYNTYVTEAYIYIYLHLDNSPLKAIIEQIIKM